MDSFLSSMCPYCQEEEDTTEYLVTCSVLGVQHNINDLTNDENTELWKQINELIMYNLDHRI